MKSYGLFLFFVLTAFASSAQISIDNFRFYMDEGKNLIVCNQLPAQGQLTSTPIQLQLGSAVVTFQNNVASLSKGVKYVVTGNSKTYNLYFTELPIINLQIPDPGQINQDVEIPGAISLSEATGNPYHSNMAIRIRGNSSASFPKKSYRVQLKDGAGKNKDESLLGLRSDKRWLFLALWNEEIRANNVVSHELWTDMHKLYYAASEPKAISSIRTKYVEVFMNKSYLGVYAFAEDMDRKQLALKKEDNGVTHGELYKADDWSLSASFAGIGVPKANPGDAAWQNWELEYPDYSDWNNHYNFLKAVIECSDDQFKATIGNLMKIDNVIDYYIFANVMLAEDNMDKNWFLARYDQNEPYFFVPWDLDGTWSYKPDGTRTNLTQGERSNELFKRLLRLDPNGFKNKLASRWFSLRQNILSESSLKNRFSSKYNLLNSNLVYEREAMATSDRYGGGDRSGGLSYIHNFITQRLAWLDGYFCPMLTNGQCGGPVSCDFNVNASASTSTPACSAAFTLSADCSGGDCNAVTYQWTGNGISQSGKSVSINAPSSNGTFTYTVTASKDGCSSKTSTVTITVSNCQSTGSGSGEPFSLCLESENSTGNGPVTGDPNASNGSTRGDQNNYNHYVDYAVNGVKATGTHQLKLRYYAAGNAQVSISVNGSVALPLVSLPATNSWNIVWREETIEVNLNEGNNTVRIQGLPGNSVRQDKICVTGSGGGTGNPPSCDFAAAPTASGNAVYTPGQAMTFNANCSGGDCGGATFSWTGNGANASGSSVSVNAPATPGDYTYTVTARKNGCADKTSTLTIRVQSAPEGPVQPFSLCVEAENSEGDGPVTSDPNASNGKTRGAQDSPIYYVDYQVNGVKATGQHDLILRYYAPGNAVIAITVNGEMIIPKYTLAATNSWNIVWAEQTLSVRLIEGNNRIRIQGLPGGSPLRQDKICVKGSGGTGNPPTCDFSVSTIASTPECSGQLTLHADCSGGDCQSVSYEWSGNGISKSGMTAYVTAPSSNGTYAYTVAATKNGCSAKTSTVNVTIAGCGSPGTGEPYAACIEAENSNGNGPITDDPNASNGKTRGDQYNYNHYVDYAVKGVKTAGIYQVKLRYYAGANAAASVSVNGTTVLASVALPATYSWNIVSREETFNVTLAAGDNTVRIQGLPGASTRQDKICVSGNGQGNARMAAAEVIAVEEFENLQAYPNPAPTEFRAVFHLAAGAGGTLRVADVQGKVWHERKIVGKGRHEERITLGDAPAGIYLLQIRKPDGIETKKILITR